MTTQQFDTDFQRYAELIAVHGLNVQPGQLVNIAAEAIHRDFALLVAEHCYARGARLVNLDLEEPRLGKLRIEKSDPAHLEYVPGWVTAQYGELVDEHAANLKIIGLEYPDLLQGVDAQQVNRVRKHRMLAIKRFYDEGIGRSQVHWTVVAAATPRWGQKIYPNLKPQEACDALWQDILKMCRADRPACLDLWREHNDALHRRATTLTERKLKSLRFVGPGTDLTVGLSDRAIWKGGQDTGPYDVPFEPNLPTEEVFTTPDYRRTEGHVRATRPFMINGVMIENLSVSFKDGAIDGFQASAGADTFAAYIDSDPGASRLGEVALVGIDSPIFQNGKVFQEILFDENAACHIAVGQAYKFCLRDGETLDSAAADAIGCNESVVHTDMMISNEDVDVTAETYDGETLTLIRAGEWTEAFK
jgi:aminopeptidase